MLSGNHFGLAGISQKGRTNCRIYQQSFVQSFGYTKNKTQNSNRKIFEKHFFLYSTVAAGGDLTNKSDPFDNTKTKMHYDCHVHLRTAYACNACVNMCVNNAHSDAVFHFFFGCVRIYNNVLMILIHDVYLMDLYVCMFFPHNMLYE